MHDIKCIHTKDIGTKFYTLEKGEDILAPLSSEKEELLKPIKARKKEVERKMRRYDLAIKLIEQHQSGIKDTEAFREFIMNAPPFDVDTIKAVCPPEESEDYLSDTIYQWFPTQEGGSSLVLINCPEGVDSKDIAESVWAAFGSFLKLPKPKYILSQSPEAKEVILTILTFDEEK